jgi:hypothetical protein
MDRSRVVQQSAACWLYQHPASRVYDVVGKAGSAGADLNACTANPGMGSDFRLSGKLDPMRIRDESGEYEQTVIKH